MPKIHPVEECICCGTNFEPLEVYDAVKDVIKKMPPDWEMFSICTPVRMTDKESDTYRFLCAGCCRKTLDYALNLLIKERKEILSRNFDDLRKELKG